jgi:hypothetical protein
MAFQRFEAGKGHLEPLEEVSTQEALVIHGFQFQQGQHSP